MMESAIQGVEPLLAKLVGMAARARNSQSALAEAGEAMIRSIQRNIDVGGRPAFKPLAESTLRQNPGGSILNRSGDLRDSFVPHVRSRDTVSADSNVIYGPRQHFGYDAPEGATGRGYSNTPARPFATIPDEDVPNIVEPLANHIWQ